MASPEPSAPKEAAPQAEGPQTNLLLATKYRDAFDLFANAQNGQRPSEDPARQEVLKDYQHHVQEKRDKRKQFHKNLLRLQGIGNPPATGPSSPDPTAQAKERKKSGRSRGRNSSVKLTTGRNSTCSTRNSAARLPTRGSTTKLSSRGSNAGQPTRGSATGLPARGSTARLSTRGSAKEFRKPVIRSELTMRGSAARLSIRAERQATMRGPGARLSVREITTQDAATGATHVAVLVPIPRIGNRSSTRALGRDPGHYPGGYHHHHHSPIAAVARQARRVSREIRNSIANLLKHHRIKPNSPEYRRLSTKCKHAFKKLALVHMIAPKDTAVSKSQARNIFDECCKCDPLPKGPVILDDGVMQMAGPNIPKIVRMLRNRRNGNLDLLQPHGVSQYNGLHVAAQRGYIDLAKALMAHWSEHPVESSVAPYSLDAIDELIRVADKSRKAHLLTFHENIELHRLAVEIGVPFARLCEELDKLGQKEFTFPDMVRICGHPLVLGKDASGNTPLHYAAEGGFLSLCQLFIAHGANINEQNNAGETPLHYALSSNHEKVCEYFVKSNADVNLARYVALSLYGSITVRGNFINGPDASTACQLLPVPRRRATTSTKHLRNPWVKWTSRYSSRVTETAQVAPSMESPLPAPPEDATTGVINSLGALMATSPLLKNRNPRDIVFFRTAPSCLHLKPNTLCLLVVGEHMSAGESVRARQLHAKGKVFHLLIEKMPRIAAIAMNAYRVPVFRCTVQAGVRDYNQHYHVDNRLSKEKRHSRVQELMKAHQKAKRKVLHRTAWGRFVAVLGSLYAVLVKLKHMINVEAVFAASELGQTDKKNVICEPKAILYEYSYENAEFRGGWSPTLNLVVQTESKELMYHPWVRQLLDHKWNSFGKTSFKLEFRLYFVYFVAFFLATYLHVGDAQVGMPVGGYRGYFLRNHSTVAEFFRDFCTIVYAAINLYYTIDEYHCYREKGSLLAYFKDDWNVFEVIQLGCVWLLFASELVESATFADKDDSDFSLYVYQDSMYSTYKWRYYNFQTTLLCIVGPQIFIKWIQFARGNIVLGPFVRMIFMMVREIFVFLIVFMVFLLGFAYAFFILQLEGYKTYLSAVFSVFQLSLGSWNWDNIVEGGPTAVILFLLYSVIGTIMMLNLLIAMLGRTYSDVWEDRFLYFHLEKAKTTLAMQTSLDANEYDSRFWCQRLFVLEQDTPIAGIPMERF